MLNVNIIQIYKFMFLVLFSNKCNNITSNISVSFINDVIHEC